MAPTTNAAAGAAMGAAGLVALSFGTRAFVAPTTAVEVEAAPVSTGARFLGQSPSTSAGSAAPWGLCGALATAGLSAAVLRAAKSSRSSSSSKVYGQVTACRAEDKEAAEAPAAAAPAAAKAPAAKKPKPFDPALQVGVTPPMDFFDPAGFCKKGDESGYRNLRAAELKHGRVAMMAALGCVVQHYVQLPIFQNVPSGINAVTTEPASYGIGALVAVSGILELFVWTENPSKEPGNFGDPANLGQYNEEMRNRELNNGRMAMFSIMGIIGAEIVSGKDGVLQLGIDVA